jgi:peptide/nickel transport system permease protein
MISYIARRILYMAIMLVGVSVIAFVIIQLPPGDYMTSYLTLLKSRGEVVDEAFVAALRHQYGLDQPMYVQYWTWASGILRGYLGYSFEWNRPVNELIGERLAYSVMLSLVSLIFSYVVAVPIGIYSATHQYKLGDYVFTVFGFIGLALPAFLVALVFMFASFKYFGLSPGGLFSPQYLTQPWSLAKLGDMLMHLPVPVIIIGLGGMASIIRVVRATTLDELQKPYVLTARSKGLKENKLLYKYPVRMAVNPLASQIGWIFPAIVSGEVIVGIVLNLPTTGPLLLAALLSQDMYLAGSLIMFLAVLTILGMLVSDLLIAWLDPRIRYE